MLVNCLLKRLEIGNVMKWNVLDATCTRSEGKNLAKSHNHVSNTMTFIQMTQIFVLNRSTMSATASISMLGTQVLGSWRSDIYLLKISNIKKNDTQHVSTQATLMEVLDIINSLHRATYSSVDGFMMYEQDENSVMYNNANTLKQATLIGLKK